MFLHQLLQILERILRPQGQKSRLHSLKGIPRRYLHCGILRSRDACGHRVLSDHHVPLRRVHLHHGHLRHGHHAFLGMKGYASHSQHVGMHP